MRCGGESFSATRCGGRGRKKERKGKGEKVAASSATKRKSQSGERKMICLLSEDQRPHSGTREEMMMRVKGIAHLSVSFQCEMV
mmetsp:Transcript_5946/g.12321  ORF Transcript_5946/g.12321 Transcript_5946/m.12321 type:complete len:84 (-) Transcript_5946:14-265(-)